MSEVKLKKFLPGLLLILMGIEVILSLDSFPRLGSIGFLFAGFYLMISSKENWKEMIKEALPFKPRNLIRFPRLPYFQTGILVLVLLGSISMIYDYNALIGALVGLAISQFILSSLKKNMKDRFKILLVMQFHIFIFFAAFIYSHFGKFYLIGRSPDYVASLFLVAACVIEGLYLYIELLK